MKTLTCQIRNIEVIVTPEELVRQKLISNMINALGYPQALICVEKSLNQIPHLAGRNRLPKRRADILCFGKNIHSQFPLFPLLIIECKATALNETAVTQAFGYNFYIQAPYICLANETQIKTFCYGQTQANPLTQLPSYQELINHLPCK